MAVKNVLFKIQADTAQLRRELDSVRAQLGQLNQTADKAQGGFGKLRGALSGAAAAFGGIQIASAALNFGKGALDAVTNYESLNIAFETFLGSAEQAKVTLSELETFSAATPFTSEQVSNAGKALLAFGEPVDNLAVTLERLGDVSSATGKDFNELAVIYGKARVQGTLFAEDINQLTEAGVPIIDEFAKQFGVSTSEVKKLGSEGKISFANLEEGFKSLTSEGGRFFGLTDKLGQSTAGRISTLEDNFGKLQRSIGEGLLPVFEFLIDTFSAAIEGVRALPSFINENRAAVTLLTGAIGVYAALQTRSLQIQIADKAIATGKLVIDRASAAIASIRNAVLTTQVAIQTRATGVTVAQTLATTALTAAQRALNAAWASNPLGLIIGVLATVAAAFYAFSDSAEVAAEETAKISREQEVLAEVEQQTAANASKEKAELDKLFTALKNTTEGSKERSKLIDQINGKYGTTLKNLKDEKEFIEQVAKAYEALSKKILIAAKAEAIRAQLVKLADEEIQLSLTIDKTKIETIASELAGQLNADKPKKEGELQLGYGFATPTKEEIQAVYAGLTDTEIVAIQKRTDELNAALAEQQNNLASAPLGANAISVGDAFDSAFQSDFEKLQENKKIQKKLVDDLIATEAEAGTVDVKSGVSKEEAKQLKEQAELYADLKKKIEDATRALKEQRVEFTEADTAAEKIKQLEDLAEIQKQQAEADTKDSIEQARKEGKLTAQIEEQYNKLLSIEKTKITLETEKEITKIITDEGEKRNEALNDLNQLAFEEQLVVIEQGIKKVEAERTRLLKELNKATNKEQKENIQAQISEQFKLLKASYEKQREIQVAQIKAQAEFDASQAGLTADQKKLIYKKADLDILKLRGDFNDKLEGLTEEEKAIVIEGIEAEKKARQEAIVQLTNEIVNLTKTIIDAAIQQTDTAIAQQEKRVAKAQEIADKGNAQVLIAEESKLRKLNQQRANYVKQQQALALIEIAANSAIAIAKAAAEGGGIASAITIAATLVALAAGFAQARAQAQSAATFARGGYTGDGSQFAPAGTVHKGEFVMNAQRTRQFRPMLEAMHAGRNPKLLQGIQERMLVVNNKSTDERLEKIERAIREQQGLQLSIDERGVHGIVSRLEYKQQRIKNKAK